MKETMSVDKSSPVEWVAQHPAAIVPLEGNLLYGGFQLSATEALIIRGDLGSDSFGARALAQQSGYERYRAVVAMSKDGAKLILHGDAPAVDARVFDYTPTSDGTGPQWTEGGGLEPVELAKAAVIPPSRQADPNQEDLLRSRLGEVLEFSPSSEPVDEGRLERLRKSFTPRSKRDPITHDFVDREVMRERLKGIGRQQLQTMFLTVRDGTLAATAWGAAVVTGFGEGNSQFHTAFTIWAGVQTALATHDVVQLGKLIGSANRLERRLEGFLPPGARAATTNPTPTGRSGGKPTDTGRR